ncbi:hypothetical protein AB1L42_15145 [Thalassoglobus sp. JC818]|uniref:hypothetical protein n=1 Tax=Thalassoglobus sp. JC818 TaxID=3232136 RepID=UPI00345AC684
MDYELALGFTSSSEYAERRREMRKYVNLKLAAYGLPIAEGAGGADLVEFGSGLLQSFHEKTRQLGNTQRSPIDQRIETFLNSHFSDLKLEKPLRLPNATFVLDRHGLARELSLPANGDVFETDYIQSFRVRNGVLHNPAADRRTTAGTFHVVEGGLPIPGDKRAVPRVAFERMFRAVFERVPESFLQLPFTSENDEPSRTWVSLFMRPLVRPEVPGFSPEKKYEVRFFVPGGFVANLDFVESIFGNAGDPLIPTNNSALDVEHWSGHTGCVILAPHLLHLTKKELGLPHISEATPRQQRDRMCWEKEDEIYNDGSAFKITCRTDEGVIVTMIADNYFGYCKKEVKTQISYSANLMGNAEEEHAGGALVFPSWNVGEEFQFNSRRYNGQTFDDVVKEYGDAFALQPEGYGIDHQFPNLFYIPEDARADLREQTISWTKDGEKQSIPLLPEKVYMAPSGYRLRMEKHPSAPSWRLIGTGGEGVFCHKPCTVSGGGKSEISKSLVDYMQYGSIFVADFDKDMEKVNEIFTQKYQDRWKPEVAAEQNYGEYPSRSVLSPRRSLGSVIKLLTPSEDYTDEYNAWLKEIPNHVYALVYAIKRFHNPDWEVNEWRKYFGVDFVNGSMGHELKMFNRRLVGTYLRVGFTQGNLWRLFKVRQDFAAAFKVQTEDDITASTVVPGRLLKGIPDYFEAYAQKFAQNCEYRLFQRPDDAIHRGFDKQAEYDLSRRDVNFISNFEPMTRSEVNEMKMKVVDFDAYTAPVKRLLNAVDKGEGEYVVCSDNPRRVGGVPTKNPRYLQDRPDMVNPMHRYVGEMGTRLFRRIPAGQFVPMPVSAVLSGRRNNPPEPEKGIRGLAVYGPIHYQELPELFMDYICSLTGKSPSTTGAGSEGALTKGPFNALRPTADLNTALVSMILTGTPGFSTAAGHIGTNNRFDHDISLLVPEIWCRLSVEERDPKKLLENRLIEPVPDLKDADGTEVPSRRLGFRITRRFMRKYLGRVFDNPETVFDETMLKPETQNPEAFIDGVKYIMEAYQRVAKGYFDDGSVEEACPPLRALLTIMAEGNYEGKDERDPEIRKMFDRETVLASEWYKERLKTQQQREIALWTKHVNSLKTFLESETDLEASFLDELRGRLSYAEEELKRVEAPSYLDDLVGTTGATPIHTTH